MAKNSGSDSRKRKADAGAPNKTEGKKRKTETKISKQAANKKDTGKNQAKVGKQKNKAGTTVSKKGNTHATVSKQKNGATAQTTVSKKGNTQATVSEQRNGGVKKPPAKAAKPEKKTEVVLKEGVPKDEELEGLGTDIGDKWTNLGRRLNIEEPKLQAIAKDFDSLHERGFQMLKHWKQKKGSGANYKSLSDSLKHKLVERKDLAEKYCFKRK